MSIAIGARAHDYGKMPADVLAKTIVTAGFSHVQLAAHKAIQGVETLAGTTEQDMANVRTAFEKENLGVSILGCYIEPALPDKTDRLAQVDIFKRGITNAKVLGTSVIGTETTHLAPDTPQDERDKRFADLLDSVLRMTEVAEKENITIAIEPVADHTLNTPELTRTLLDKVGSDKLKVIFDPFNLTLPSQVDNQARIYQAVFDLLSNDIAIIHLKDMVVQDNKKTWANIGTGQIRYDVIFPHLNKHWAHVPMLREEVKPEFAHIDIQNFLKFRAL